MGIQRDAYASYKLLAKELVSLGYSVEDTMENDRTIVTYTSPAGKSWSTPAANLNYPVTPPAVKALSQNKDEATKFAVAKGVNAPATLRVDKNYIDENAVADFVTRYGKLVVKPLDRSLSLGLTTDVSTVPRAIKAIASAAEHSSGVLVQEQVFGDEIRFAVIDGKVISALMRQTPRVVGDGVSTVKKLIDQDNKQRQAIDYSLVPYPLLAGSMIRKSVDLKAIPGNGEVVELSRATMVARGCSVYDVLEQVHSSYLSIVRSLVDELDTGFIVVDMFVENYREPARDNNYWFIEFNTSPVLKLFYACRDGNMHDILPALARAIDKKIHAVKKRTLGGFEHVAIPNLGIKRSIAKIDTGAYSGAVGCSMVEVVKRNGKKTLRFSPGKRSKQVFETTAYSERRVRSSSGHSQKRYLIETEVIIQDHTYPITIGLSDRSDMKHEILIGRRFLREQNLLVDVSINQEYDTDREVK
jgi:D-alanine-D-alanine ligase-like ATP-grasp enzyme